MSNEQNASACTKPSLAAVRLLVLDVDGVLTDGRLHIGEHGETVKCFHARDGLGIRMLLAAGIEVAVISARDSAMLRHRLDELGVTRRRLGRSDKRRALDELVVETGHGAGEVAFLGDDLLDLPAMAAVGVAMAVVDAHPLVRERAAWVSVSPGGRGAVRDACEALLASSRDFPRFVDEYLDSLEAAAQRGDDGGETAEHRRGAA